MADATTVAPEPADICGLINEDSTRRPAARVPWGSGTVASSGRCFAVLTSGGDAQGMNAAVRAAVATGLSFGHTVYAVMHGYRGLVEGGESIRRMGWEDVDDILSRGGTVIGTARCDAFRTREGRLKAAFNVVTNKITNLIVIGGDGSLTGANVFKTEWSGLLASLLAESRITAELAAQCSFLNIIGMVGSIDNDMCGFSMTIGADSAMQRIVDACDALITTAASHQRSFVVEVMGRNCGYLALMAGVAVGADWVFLPESPPDSEDWETTFVESILKRRQHSNYTLVIVSEGSTDRTRRPITSAYVKDVLTQRLGWDTRVTCLGHVQRGGAPSAYDRCLGSRLGSEAVLALLDSTEEIPARILGIRWNQLVKVDLDYAVTKNGELAGALKARNFKLARQLRGAGFAEILDVFLRVRRMRPLTPPRVFRVAVVFVGAPAAGMNAVAKTCVRELVNFGHVALGINGGFVGLARGDLRELSWSDVSTWSQLGGASLGTNRTLPSEIRASAGTGFSFIAKTLARERIDALLVIGGFEAFAGLLELAEARKSYAELCIPMCLVPATISNNVPGTDFSIGCDTAANAISEAIDRLKLSAASSRGRVFLVETMGAYSGYLATIGALAGGADAVYTHEEGVHMDTILHDVGYLRKKFQSFSNAVIVRNEKCSDALTMPVMQSLFEDEGSRPGSQFFSTRTNILGHLQQGNSPSCLDRVRATRLGSAGVNQILRLCNTVAESGQPCASKESIFVSGICGPSTKILAVEDLVDSTDFEFRKPRRQWHEKLAPLVRLLEKNNADKWGAACELEATAVLLPNESL